MKIIFSSVYFRKKDGNAVIWTYGPIVLAILLLCLCVLVGWLIVTGNWRKYLRKFFFVEFSIHPIHGYENAGSTILDPSEGHMH